jgi:CRP-like cAMP-binding protein
MFHLILNNFAKHIDLSAEEMAKITEQLLRRKVYSRSRLHIAGEICQHLYFVNSGCLRIYHTDEDGNEHTVSFSPENWWATDITSFSSQKPSQFAIEALEDADLWSLHYHALEALYIEVPKLERFFRILTENGYSILQRRIVSYSSKSALQRYRQFHKQYPKLESRIPQKHIASFLGITPVFLSRLRQRI